MAPLTLVRHGTLKGTYPAEIRQMFGSRDWRRGRSAPTKNEEDPVAEAYCVKDKQKVEIVKPEKITMKNGKPATKGTCPLCGGSVFRIGG